MKVEPVDDITRKDLDQLRKEIDSAIHRSTIRVFDIPNCPNYLLKGCTEFRIVPTIYRRLPNGEYRALKYHQDGGAHLNTKPRYRTEITDADKKRKRFDVVKLFKDLLKWEELTLQPRFTFRLVEFGEYLFDKDANVWQEYVGYGDTTCYRPLKYSKDSKGVERVNLRGNRDYLRRTFTKASIKRRIKENWEHIPIYCK